MIIVRPSAERGKTQLDWLQSFHTFSFDQYDDPRYRNFGSLRVINEDFVGAGKGFPSHPHRDMEIITYVVEGQIAHKDNLGTGSLINVGEIQKMSAGKGVIHSEYNPSPHEVLHLLQIWIMPNKKGIPPQYEQKKITRKLNTFILIGSPEGDQNAVRIQQKVNLYAAYLEPQISLECHLDKKNIAWIQVIKGEITLNDTLLLAGDGAAIQDETDLHFYSKKSSELLFFDMG